MRTRLLLAAAATLAIGASACTSQDSITAVSGSGSSKVPASSGSSTTAKVGNPDFVEQADAICSDVKDQLSALPEPSTKAEFDEYIDESVTIAEKQLDDLSELGPPDDSALWDETLDVLRESNERLKELVDAGKSVKEIGEDDKYLELRETNRSNARKLGLEVCGGGTSGSSSTSSTTTTEPQGRGDIIPDDPPAGTFTGADCAAIRTANAELYLATERAEAEVAAQVIIGFTPPTDVRGAIEVLVDGPGIQVDDGGLTAAASDQLDTWIESVCPA